MPFGITWSKRMSIEIKHLVDLFAGDVGLFDDFVDCGSGLEVF